MPAPGRHVAIEGKKGLRPFRSVAKPDAVAERELMESGAVLPRICLGALGPFRRHYAIPNLKLVPPVGFEPTLSAL